MSIQLPDITLVAGTPVTLTLPSGVPLARISWIEFINESPFSVSINCGGINQPIPSWDDYPLEINRKINGVWTPVSNATEPVNLTPVLLSNNLVTNISTTLQVVVYSLGEMPPITTPRSLFRQGYIPNTVNTVGGIASQVQNDGNALLNVVEATISGDVNSDVEIRNNGTQTLGTALNPGSLSITNNTQTVKYDASGIGIGISGNVLNCASTANTWIEGTNSASLFVGGNNILAANATGASVITGTFKLPVGQAMSGWSWGNGVTGATGTVVVNHGLGVTPSAIVINGYNSINNSWGANAVGATSFTAVVSSGNAKTFSWIAFI